MEEIFDRYKSENVRKEKRRGKSDELENVNE
jgi:hypothetical protein